MERRKPKIINVVDGVFKSGFQFINNFDEMIQIFDDDFHLKVCSPDALVDPVDVPVLPAVFSQFFVAACGRELKVNSIADKTHIFEVQPDLIADDDFFSRFFILFLTVSALTPIFLATSIGDWRTFGA